jgi:hypothetical protein
MGRGGEGGRVVSTTRRYRRRRGGRGRGVDDDDVPGRGRLETKSVAEDSADRRDVRGAIHLGGRSVVFVR